MSISSELNQVRQAGLVAARKEMFSQEQAAPPTPKPPVRPARPARSDSLQSSTSPVAPPRQPQTPLPQLAPAAAPLNTSSEVSMDVQETRRQDLELQKSRNGGNQPPRSPERSSRERSDSAARRLMEKGLGALKKALPGPVKWRSTQSAAAQAVEPVVEVKEQWVKFDDLENQMTDKNFKGCHLVVQERESESDPWGENIYLKVTPFIFQQRVNNSKEKDIFGYHEKAPREVNDNQNLNEPDHLEQRFLINRWKTNAGLMQVRIASTDDVRNREFYSGPLQDLVKGAWVNSFEALVALLDTQFCKGYGFVIRKRGSKDASWGEDAFLKVAPSHFQKVKQDKDKCIICFRQIAGGNYPDSSIGPATFESLDPKLCYGISETEIQAGLTEVRIAQPTEVKGLSFEYGKYFSGLSVQGKLDTLQEALVGHLL